MGQLDQVKMIDLPKITDQRGNLTFVEGGRHIPFDIKRVYYLYDVPGGAERGGHAHKELRQFIIDFLSQPASDKRKTFEETFNIRVAAILTQKRCQGWIFSGEILPKLFQCQ